MTMKKLLGILLILAMLFVAACSTSESTESTDSAASSEPVATATPEVKISGTINIDGSSTVFPISEAVTEEFGKSYPDVRVPVGVSGTGGGFKRFCAGETDISNASRPIKDSEAELCKTNGVEYIELAVTYDGLTVVINKDNTWAKSMTVEQLKMIFEPESKVKNWSDVDSSWPAEKIEMFSPGADSGTFDYFTEAINGKSQASRNDDQISFSEDDNVLVTGVSGNKNAIGYFGFSYYEENASKLEAVSVDGGKGPVAPSLASIRDGSYAPLGRPLFIYVSKKAYEKPEVQTYAKFFIDNVNEVATQVGFVPLPDDLLAQQKAKLQ